MSFWNLSDGKQAEQNTEFESGGGNFDPIPAGTNCLAVIDEAKWDSKGEGYDKAEFISIRWSVMKPEEYQNRKVFQKLWVKDLDPNVKDREKAIKKKDKALRMLAAIDTNAGGKLMSAGVEPTDDLLQSALVGKAMVTSLQTWTVNKGTADEASGNWVAAVAAKGEREIKKGEEKSKVQASAPNDLGSDEIPF